MARISRVSRSELAFCIVSFHEQVLGCNAYISRAGTSADVVRGYGIFGQVLSAFAAAVVLPFDINAASVFEDLVGKRIRIATMDLRIAAIALGRGSTLLTRNFRDFNKVPGLAMEDWTI